MMLQKSPQDQQATPEVSEKEEREQKYLKPVFKLSENSAFFSVTTFQACWER